MLEEIKVHVVDYGRKNLYMRYVDPLTGKSGALKLTTAKFYAPSGTSIHGVGIKPDLPLQMTETEMLVLFKRQQQEWVRINRPKNSPPSDELKDLPTPYWKAADKQLSTAVECMRIQLRDGKDAAKVYAKRYRDEENKKLKAAKTASKPNASSKKFDRQPNHPSISVPAPEDPQPVSPTK
jgi:hypothetical protein